MREYMRKKRADEREELRKLNIPKHRAERDSSRKKASARDSRGV
jgi:hypothetical protein